MNVTATKKTLKLFFILSLVLLSFGLYTLTSRSQVYVYYNSVERTINGYYINPESDNTIVSQPVASRSQVSTHAKSDNTIPKPFDLIPKYNQLITPESELVFPYPNVTRTPHEMLNSPWATKLKAKLDAAKIGKQLTYVTVSMNYFPVLINWLIYAKLNAMPILENLLVVCMDKPSHEVLSRKGILSHIVTINDIIYSIKDMDGSGIFSARVITRLTVLRLLNYWGYDVLIMDIDALLINNIQPILDHFHESDIIMSTANARNCIPSAARKLWGFCLCIGLLLIRGNANTGMSAICVWLHNVDQTWVQLH